MKTILQRRRVRLTEFVARRSMYLNQAARGWIDSVAKRDGYLYHTIRCRGQGFRPERPVIHFGNVNVHVCVRVSMCVAV